MKTIELTLSGMTCSGCAETIEKALAREGVIDAEVDYQALKGVVLYDEKRISEQEIVEAVNAIGHYRVEAVNFVGRRQDVPLHLIIVGGGSAAFAAAIQAKSYGVRVTMVNSGLPIGGTCVNVGCIPSKNLMRAAERLYNARHNPFEGIASSAEVTDFHKLIKQKEQLVEELRRHKYIDIVREMEGIELIEGEAKLLDGKSVQTGDRIIKGSHILIATGARPFIPSVEGMESVPYITNEEVFALQSLPTSMIVIGGSYIALEIAQMFARFGTKITILQRSDHLLSHQHRDIGTAIGKYFANEGIEVVTGTRISRIEKCGENICVHTRVNGRTKTFEAEKLLVATGRKANTEDLNLDNVGIECNNDGSVRVNSYLQTDIPAVYAAGDVLGTHMFVYTAAYEGKLAVDNMFGKSRRADYSVLPWVIFTDPQVAGIGMDEMEAQASGIDFEVAVLPMDQVPRSLAARDTRGFIKLLRNKADDRLIGARIIVPEGSELLMEIAVAMRYRVKIGEITEMFHPYLTLSEGIKLAAIAFDKDIAKLSCCAT